jgi:V/A-type H+-transporting ATPase subunit D
MVLTGLKKRLRTARRGHKLLKDKRDELMKKFLEIVRENRREREIVEQLLMDVHSRFIMARRASLNTSTRNIMSVDVPVLEFTTEGTGDEDIFPYGFANTSGELDGAIQALSEALPHMLRLAELEKSAQLLSDEIEKTRRRVNALEYVLIPNLEDTIKYIIMKLDENERGNLTRLMKVKDMMLEQVRQQHLERDGLMQE